MKTAAELRAYFETEIRPGLQDLETWRKKALRRAVVVDTLFAVPLVVLLIKLLGLKVLEGHLTRGDTITLIVVLAFLPLGILYALMTLGVIDRYTLTGGPAEQIALVLAESLLPLAVVFALRARHLVATDGIANTVAMVVMLSFLSLGLQVPYYAVWRHLRYDNRTMKTAEGRDIGLYRYNELLYKRLVIGKLVPFVSSDLTYSPDAREISGEEALKGELFPHAIFYPAAYVAEDFIEGTIGRTRVRFFEISGRSAVRPRKDIGDFPYETFPFHGMLGEVDFNKSFRGHTLVLPEARVRRSEWIRRSGRRPVRLEDPEFEQSFSVFSTDPIAARYILSLSLMKRITDYRRKVGRKLSLSFTRNKLHVAIPHRKDQFEFSMYRPVCDFGRVMELYSDLAVVTDIVEDLNLNTAIWLRADEQAGEMFGPDSGRRRRKEWVYRFLLYAFGYLGLHYLYIGYTLKGLACFLVTMAVFPYLIWRSIHWEGSFLVLLLWIGPLALLWYFYIWHKGHWIDRDSTGKELEW